MISNLRKQFGASGNCYTTSPTASNGNANNIEKVKIDWNPPVTEKNKPSVLKYLDRAYDTLKTTVEKASINDTTILGFSSTIDHITHHRGQAVTYLRCKGINPPEYSY